MSTSNPSAAMLSENAIAYALVDLFEFGMVQLRTSRAALQVMSHAATPCTLSRQGDLWAVRLGAFHLDDGVRLRVERATATPARLQGVA